MSEGWKSTITLLLLGVFMGWGMAAVTLTNNPWSTLSTTLVRGAENQDVSHPITNLPLKVNYLLAEHSEAIISLTQAKYDNSDLQKPSDALEANNQRLAGLASKIYGEKARGMFLQMLKEHNLEIMNYTQGVKVEDEQLKEKSKKNLENINTQLIENIRSLNPDYPADELSALINDYIKLNLEAIDLYSQKSSSLEDVDEKVIAMSSQAEKISQFLIQNL